MNKINKQHKNRLIGTENRLRAVGGEGSWGNCLKQMKGLSTKTKTNKKKTLIDTDNSMEIARGKG